MINETYKNVLFGVATTFMMLASVKHSKYITENLDEAEKYYHGYNFGVIVTCLFSNVCLGIFSFFILGNLNDFIHKMCVNLIGACQKLRVLAILMILSLGFYSASNFSCFTVRSINSNINSKLIMSSIIVVISQSIHLFSIQLLHPDMFGFRWAKKVRDCYKNNKKLIAFI